MCRHTAAIIDHGGKTKSGSAAQSTLHASPNQPEAIGISTAVGSKSERSTSPGGKRVQKRSATAKSTSANASRDQPPDHSHRPSRTPRSIDHSADRSWHRRDNASATGWKPSERRTHVGTIDTSASANASKRFESTPRESADGDDHLRTGHVAAVASQFHLTVRPRKRDTTRASRTMYKHAISSRGPEPHAACFLVKEPPRRTETESHTASPPQPPSEASVVRFADTRSSTGGR